MEEDVGFEPSQEGIDSFKTLDNRVESHGIEIGNLTGNLGG